MKISWKNTKVTTELTYSDLQVGESFYINSGKGAVYTKVVYRDRSYTSKKDEYFQLEIATGKLFKPTNSGVRRVNVEVQIDVNKPSIY